MREGWRWFGPLDAITLPQIAQPGATDIVTSLHEFPFGAEWPKEAINDRKALIEWQRDRAWPHSTRHWISVLVANESKSSIWKPLARPGFSQKVKIASMPSNTTDELNPMVKFV